MEEKLNKICTLLGLGPFFKGLTDNKSIEIIFHPALLVFLRKSGVTDNQLISRILGPGKMKAEYLKTKHPNFYYVDLIKDEVRLNYIDLAIMKGRIRKSIANYYGEKDDSIEEGISSIIKILKGPRPRNYNFPSDIRVMKDIIAMSSQPDDYNAQEHNDYFDKFQNYQNMKH